MEGCPDYDLSLPQFRQRYSANPRQLFDLCIRHKLVLKEKACERCGKLASLYFSRFLWRCHKLHAVKKKKKKICNWSQSVFKNTFLAHNHSNLVTFLTFINDYLRESYSHIFVRRDLHLSSPTICEWAGFCREVLLEWCIKQEGKIGGEGITVEIIESKVEKIRYGVGQIVEGQSVYCGLCREIGSCFMVCVKNQNSETLQKIIEEWVKPGTTIVSDCWKIYDCLSEEGYQQLAANHSISFAAATSASRSNVNQTGQEAKSRVPLHGKKIHLAGYLARSLFMLVHKNPNKRFHKFLEEVGVIYNPYQALKC